MTEAIYFQSSFSDRFYYCDTEHQCGYGVGATYSSVGIIQAVRDALSQAVVNGTSDGTQDNNSNNSNNNSSSDDNSSTVTGTVPYKEGIYYGTAEGYSGDVSVAKS